MLLHSPAEPRTVVAALRKAAAPHDIDVESSSLCEARGVDFLWFERGRGYGCQRKELHDFFASLDDGRLAREVPQMLAHITMPLLILEGNIRTTNEGMLLLGTHGRPRSYSDLTNHLLSLQFRGIGTFHVTSVAATAQLVVDTYLWSRRDRHTTATTRPKPAGNWGKPSSRDWQLHLMTSLPGVGLELAAAILDTLGRCPIVVDASETELLTVPGIGKGRARKILAAVQGRGSEMSTVVGK